MIRRLDDLALEKYAESIIHKALGEAYESRQAAVNFTVQNICSNFPPAKVSGLAAVVVGTIYSHSVQISDWEAMKEVLEKSLHHFEVLENKASAMSTENSNISENVELQKIKLGIENDHLVTVPKRNEYTDVFHTFMTETLAEKGETVRPAEKMVCALSLLNLKAACVRIDSYAKEILSMPNASRALSLTNEVAKTIDELQPRAVQLKTIQQIQITIKKYLDTGPYKTWEEVQCEFIQQLTQQSVLHLYANKLSKHAVDFCALFSKMYSLKKQKMIITACIHPAVTRLDATTIPTNVLQELLPKLKDLQGLAIEVKVENEIVSKEDAHLISCLAKWYSKLRSLHVSLHEWVIPRELGVSEILLEDAFAVLPTTLTSLSLALITDHIRSLDKMAQSRRFGSLKKILLQYIHCSHALHKDFSNLTSVAILMSPMSNHLFCNVGGWLKEMSFIQVSQIDIGTLANNCPALEILKVRKCELSAPFVAGPIPSFKSLKIIHFVKSKLLDEQLAHRNNNCFWCILQRSLEIESALIATRTAIPGRCFQKFMKSNQMVHLLEFELYQCGSTFQGLITADLAVQLINTHPALSWVGGIDTQATQTSLSKMYPDKTFTCLSERAKKYKRKSDPDNVFIDYCESDDSSSPSGSASSDSSPSSLYDYDYNYNYDEWF